MLILADGRLSTLLRHRASWKADARLRPDFGVHPRRASGLLKPLIAQARIPRLGTHRCLVLDSRA